MKPAEEIAAELTELPLAERTGRRLPYVLQHCDLIELERRTNGPRENLLFRLLYASGARLAELLQLQWQDVNWEASSLRLASRTTYLDPATLRLLADLRKPEGPVLEMQPGEAEEALGRWAEESGIAARYRELGRTFSAQVLRHTYACHCTEGGLDALRLKELLGLDVLFTAQLLAQTDVASLLSEYDATHPLADTL